MKRKIDSLGRLTIPIEMRNEVDLNEGDVAEIVVNDDSIVVTKANKPNLREQLGTILEESKDSDSIPKASIEDLLK